MGACTCSNSKSKSVALIPTTANSSSELPKFRYFRRDLGMIIEISGQNARVVEDRSLEIFPANSAIGLESEWSLLIAGGSGQDGQLRADFSRVDLFKMRCKSCEPLPVPCKFGNLLRHNERIYYVGGYQNSDKIPLYYYQVDLKKWRKIKPLGETVITQLVYPGTFLKDERIYFVGGQLGSHTQVVSNYKIYYLQLSNFECKREEVNLPLAVNGALCFNNGEDVLVMGGWAPSDLSKMNKKIFRIKPNYQIVRDAELPCGIIENYPAFCHDSMVVICSYPNLATFNASLKEWASYEMKIKNYTTPKDSRMEFEEKPAGNSLSSHSDSDDSSSSEVDSDSEKQFDKTEKNNIHDKKGDEILGGIKYDDKESAKRPNHENIRNKVHNNFSKGTGRNMDSSSSDDEEDIQFKEMKLKKALSSSVSSDRSDIPKIGKLKNINDSSEISDLDQLDSDSSDPLDKQFKDILKDYNKIKARTSIRSADEEEKNPNIMAEKKKKGEIAEIGEKKGLKDEPKLLDSESYHINPEGKFSGRDRQKNQFETNKKYGLKKVSSSSDSIEDEDKLVIPKIDSIVESSSYKNSVKKLNPSANSKPSDKCPNPANMKESKDLPTKEKTIDRFAKPQIVSTNEDKKEKGAIKNDTKFKGKLKKVPLGYSPEKEPEISPIGIKQDAEIKTKMNAELKPKMNPERQSKSKTERKQEDEIPNVPSGKSSIAKQAAQQDPTDNIKKYSAKKHSSEDSFSDDSVPIEIEGKEIAIDSKVSKNYLNERSDSSSSSKHSKKKHTSKLDMKNKPLEYSKQSGKNDDIKYPKFKQSKNSSSSEKDNAASLSTKNQKNPAEFQINDEDSIDLKPTYRDEIMRSKENKFSDRFQIKAEIKDSNESQLESNEYKIDGKISAKQFQDKTQQKQVQKASLKAKDLPKDSNKAQNIDLKQTKNSPYLNNSSSSSEERKPVKDHSPKIAMNQPLSNAPVFQLKAKKQGSSSSEEEFNQEKTPKLGSSSKNQMKKNSSKLANQTKPPLNILKNNQDGENKSKISLKMSDSSDGQPNNLHSKNPSNLKNTPVIKISAHSGNLLKNDSKRINNESNSSSDSDEGFKGNNIKKSAIVQKQNQPIRTRKLSSSSSSSQIQTKAPVNRRRVRNSKNISSSSSDSNPVILRGGRN